MNENFEESPNPSSFDNLDNPSPYNNPEPQYPAPRRRSPKKFLYILGGVVVVLILLNFVRLISSKASKATPSPTPTPTISFESPSPAGQSSPSASPTSTPVSSIDKTSGLDRAKLSVQIQNGSGTAGVAGKASDLLKSLGYNVVGTGNADNFNYTNVTIKVKSASKDYLPVLNKDLSSNSYSVGSTSADLIATSSADALVIVGK